MLRLKTLVSIGVIVAVIASVGVVIGQGASTCITGGAVSSDKRELAVDCDTLLDLKSTIQGSGSLNWSDAIPITQWDGIRMGGSPERVTVFKLQKRNMDGTIPAELGRLEKLRDIWLYNNNLTGPLPAELGNLADLETLMLSHNNLSGQIPQSLNDLTLQRLWLKGNDFTGCMPANLLRVPDGDAAGLNLPTCVDTAGRLNAIEDRIDGIEARVVALEANVSRLMGTTIVNEGEEAPKETIVFSDLNWTSAQVQNRIAQFIVEYGYGYPTDVIFGGTLPNFVGLQAGDIHVTLEIWLPNQSIGWEKAVENGDVVSVGTSLVGDWQSTFVIPKYIADAHPDLMTPQDLMKPEYQELFATADSRGKARLVACVPTWSCSLVNTQQIDTYGLADHLHVITPGDQSAMFAEVYAAFAKEEPWLGYMWATGDPALKLDLVRLEEEPYTKECWDTDKGCAFAESLVLAAVHKSLLPRAPEVIGMLQNWEFSIDIYKSIFQWMDTNEGSEASDAAIWFLKNNKVWETWVTPEAEAAVNDALERLHLSAKYNS